MSALALGAMLLLVSGESSGGARSHAPSRTGDAVSSASVRCADERMRQSGHTYYYCDCGPGSVPGCVPGSDAHSGTTAKAPRRTGWKARFTSMSAGDTVALCRGGSFAGDGSNTRNRNCRAERTCDLRDYEDPRFPLPPGESRPLIDGGRVGYFPVPPGDHYEGFRFFNLQSANSRTGQGPFFFSGDVTDVDVCNVFVHDGDLGVYFADAALDSHPASARIAVRQSTFARMIGGVLGGCTDCVLDDNYFANDSYQSNSILHHPVYLTGGAIRPVGRPIRRMKVINNAIHGCPPGTTTGAVLLVVHGQHEDLLVENNLIQCDNPGGVSPSQWGISLGNGAYTDSVASFMRRSIVRRNRVIGNGEYGIELSQAAGSIIEDNLVIMPRGADGHTAIITGFGKPRGPPNNDPINDDIIIRNNTIYFPTASTHHRLRGIAVTREGAGYAVTNNVIYFGAGGETQCFELSLPPSAYSLLSNNACNGSWGTIYDSRRVKLTTSPFERTGTDFTPALGSPLVDAGAPEVGSRRAVGSIVWSASDAGKARDERPDIGAFER